MTRAQSLWVDDHHTMQMSWRSSKWQFVNFTGTAGVWRASAIATAGGWRAASLVEDCELSFRHLFAGFRTTFVKEIVVPAELPATYTAYKAQQRRWTQGWVQLQRLHLRTLLFRFRCSPLRKLHLVYHMCIAWQWPLWALWTLTLPLMIYTGHWLGGSDATAAVLLYLAPTCSWALLAATTASLETKHTYSDEVTPSTFVRRVRRAGPAHRPEHGDAAASVQLVRRRSLRWHAQRVRAHPEGRVDRAPLRCHHRPARRHRLSAA